MRGDPMRVIILEIYADNMIVVRLNRDCPELQDASGHFPLRNMSVCYLGT